MSRVALLIGVSGHSPELQSLSRVHNDIEILQRILSQRQFEVHCCCDRSLEETQTAIENCFKDCQPADQILFLFTGYAGFDSSGKLYLMLPDHHGNVRSRAIAAGFVQDAMNRSLATHQVVILDCCFHQTLGTEPTAASVSMALHTFCQDRQILLTASTTADDATEPQELGWWSYTRYLADAIETAIADTDRDGRVSAHDLHHYAAGKLKIAAPAMTPHLYGSEELANLPLIQVSHSDPAAKYRAIVEHSIQRGDVDTTGFGHLTQRRLLDDIRQHLKLSSHDAQMIEAQALRPFAEYRQRLQWYQKKVAEMAGGQTISGDRKNLVLTQLRQALSLTKQNTAPIDAADWVAEHHHEQEQRQQDLNEYAQLLLAAMRRQYPLNQSDRQILNDLQQELNLNQDEVHAIEEQLMAQIQQGTGEESDAISPGADGKSPATDVSHLDPGSVQIDSETSPPSSTTVSPPGGVPADVPAVTDLPSNNATPAPTALSREKEAVLQRLVDVTYSQSQETAPPRQADTASPTSSAKASETETKPLVSPPTSLINPTKQASTRSFSKQSQANSLKALIVLGVLTAAIAGTVAAFYPLWKKFLPLSLTTFADSGNSVENAKKAQALLRQGTSNAQKGQYPQAIAAYDQAIRLNPKAVDIYISRGLAYHRQGDTNAAIENYNQAIELEPKAARAYSNRSHVYYDRGEYQKAFEDANKALAHNPNLAEARVNLANAKSKLNKVDEALQDYTLAIQLNPPDKTLLAGTYTNRGNVRMGVDANAAIADYNKAIQLKADYADAYYNRGFALGLLGTPQAAIASLQQAATLYGQQGNSAMKNQALSQIEALKEAIAKPAPESTNSPSSL
jgi:tetratricopeptide (TPR) repeat protein